MLLLPGGEGGKAPVEGPSPGSLELSSEKQRRFIYPQKSWKGKINEGLSLPHRGST